MDRPFTIRSATAADDAARSVLLAPTYGADATALRTEMADIRSRFGDFGDLSPGLVSLVAEDGGGVVIGAAEATIRLYANGAECVKVMFLEGIAVETAHHDNGIATALIARLEDIARQAGIAEMASDARLDDAAALAFHHANGFAETEQVACFVRKISG